MPIDVPIPVSKSIIRTIAVGDVISVTGRIYTARDAVLPKIARLIEKGCTSRLQFDLEGAAIMHTAVSPAGFGPTSSNKEEIEGTMGILSQAGVSIHIGKGMLKSSTVSVLAKFESIYVVTPPVTALLRNRMLSSRIVAFEEEGMEALHELVVDRLPGVVAVAHGESIFS